MTGCIVAEPQLLGDQQMQLILGSLMGDGNLSPNRAWQVRHPVPDGTRCEAGRVPGLEGIAARQHRAHAGRSNAKGAVFADFTPLPELAELHEAVYFGDGKKHLTWDYLKALTPLALAVWYMDDGSFTVRSKGLQERTQGGTGPDRDLRRGDEPWLAGPARAVPAGHARTRCPARDRRARGR